MTVSTDPAGPTAPASLPEYLAEGLPKQDDRTLQETQQFIDELLEHRQQDVDETDLPDEAEPIEDHDSGKGTVVEEYVTCGDESCSCMTGESKGHGPYLYRYYYEGGSLTSEYVGKATE